MLEITVRRQDQMKEQIIFAPGLNGNELLRSLALQGVNSIGIRICGGAELARLALMRSGIAIKEEFVSSREETAVVAEAVKGEPYFGRASFSDIQEITAAIRRMRHLAAAGDEAQILQDTLSKGLFQEKNAALLHVYQKYMAGLLSRKALDAASLIRRAASESIVIDAEFAVLEEYPLTPLEKALLQRVSGGHVSTGKVQDLFDAGNTALRLACIKNCYGAPNEVETVLESIYSGKNLDQSIAAVTDIPVYSQLFFDYALLYDIPMTFGCGIPVMNSNPARLLSLYYRWSTGGFFGAEAIREMISGRAFDRKKLFDQFPEKDENFSWKVFYDLLGSLRLTDSLTVNEERIKAFKTSVENEIAGTCEKDSKKLAVLLRKKSCIPCLEITGRELALPVEEFISKYARIRRGDGTNAERLLTMLDLSAVNAICEELSVIRQAGVDQSAEDLIPDILRITVCRQNSEPGKLHVTGIDGAFASLRKNLYLMGMSASKFPGFPKENYLLLDADLKLFGPEAEMFTADGRILQKREQLLSLVRLACSLGAEVSVSYAGMDVSELKKDNASSLVFELVREMNGKPVASRELEKQITKVEYFDPAISTSRLVGNAYVRGRSVLPAAQTERNPLAVDSWNPDRAYSPTALDIFFGCPYRFLLGYILGIPEPVEYDPFEIISALENGTLAHSLMETLGSSGISRDDFLKLSAESFDRFLTEHPPLIPENAPAEKEAFLEMMETAFDMDPQREVLLKEEDISCVHESGVRIHGFPDRVERLEDGSCLVVDFKSGRRITHVQDDIHTCLQIVLYSYLMEQKGYKVSGGEFRYIRLRETVSCRYDDDMKKQLSELLQKFRTAMEKGNFPPARIQEDGENPCLFCGYKEICGGPEREGTVV